MRNVWDVDEAFMRSIVKWERIISEGEFDLGCTNCALCEIFKRDDNECKGCPVAEVSDNTDCWGTPYTEWMRFMRQRQRSIPYSIKFLHDKDKPEATRLAQAELDFLKNTRKEFQQSHLSYFSKIPKEELT